jgi:hypothetical protein
MYDNQLAGIGGVGSALQQGNLCRMPTLQERLDLAVTQAEERLAAVKQARDIFARNPDMELLLNLMQKGLF